MGAQANREFSHLRAETRDSRAADLEPYTQMTPFELTDAEDARTIDRDAGGRVGLPTRLEALEIAKDASGCVALLKKRVGVRAAPRIRHADGGTRFREALSQGPYAMTLDFDARCRVVAPEGDEHVTNARQGVEHRESCWPAYRAPPARTVERENDRRLSEA
jgi:hypothetical protein